MPKIPAPLSRAMRPQPQALPKPVPNLKISADPWTTSAQWIFYNLRGDDHTRARACPAAIGKFASTERGSRRLDRLLNGESQIRDDHSRAVNSYRHTDRLRGCLWGCRRFRRASVAIRVCAGGVHGAATTDTGDGHCEQERSESEIHTALLA